MEHPRVEGWETEPEEVSTWWVVRVHESGRLWGYPESTAKWILEKNPDAYEFVCEITDFDTMIHMLKLANHELKLQLKER